MEVVKMDSKGRILIPEEIRRTEGIEPETPLQLVDLGRGVLVLRKVDLPSREEIIEICRDVRREVFEEKVEPWLEKAAKPEK